MPLQTVFQKPRMLAAIDWLETSGVDHPANLEEGWAVMKAAVASDDISAEDLAQIIEEEEQLVKAQDALYRLLDVSAEAGYFDTAPDDIRKSVSSLADWLQKEGFGVEGKPDAARKSMRDRMVSTFKTILSRGGGKGSDEDDLAEFSEAIKAFWPEFCDDIAAIHKSEVGLDVKRGEIADAVAALTSYIEFAKADVSTKPWDGAASNYDSTEAYCSACLIDENKPGEKKVQSMCKLPVKEPGGALNANALRAAAAALGGARGGVDASPDAMAQAKKKLMGLERMAGIGAGAKQKTGD